MAYEAKTNWLPDDEIREDDLNRWEQGIDDAHSELDRHKNDLSNPHRVTKKQVGLGNVDDVQQAPKKEFDNHRDNVNNPHKVNSTQINVISAKSATAKYNEYPKGITIAETGTGTSMGYPWDFVLIETEQLGENRTVQTIYDVSSATVTRTMVRKYREADGGWGEWAKTETEAAAQEKVNQALEAAKKYTTDNAQMYKLTQNNGDFITTSTRLNDIKSPGLYFTTSSTDSPNGAGYLEVKKNGTQISQIFWHNISSAHFKRHFDPTLGTWQTWERYETTTGAQAKADAALISAQKYSKENSLSLSQMPTSGNLGDFTELNAFFSFDTGKGEALNTPYGNLTKGSARVFVVKNVGNASTRIEQTFTDIYPSNKWREFRRVKTEGSWGDWFEIETVKGSQTKADTAEKNAKDASLPRNASAPLSGDLSIQKDTPRVYLKADDGTILGTIRVNNDGAMIIAGTNNSTMYFRPGGDNDSNGEIRMNKHEIRINGVKVASETVAQGYADKAETNAKSASLPNLEVAVMDGNAPLSDYPSGYSIKRMNNQETNFPTSTGVLITYNYDTHRNFQLLQTKDMNKIQMRHFNSVSNTWSSWTDLETASGAQVKADTAEKNAINYAKNYGLGVAARTGIDWNAIATTGYYAGSTNGPSGNSTFIGFHVQHGSAYAYQEAGRNGIYYMRTKENGEWTKWEQTETVSGSASRVLTARDEAISRAVAQAKSYTDEKNDYEVYWTNATWRSGHSGDLQWCIKAGFLVVKGMWNNTGETGIQIASVPAAPKYRTYINAPTIGSYGEARVTLGNDGVITVDGLNANNNASVTRLEILFVIPVESRG